MSDDNVEKAVDGIIARKIVWWFVGGGALLLVSATLYAQDIRSRVVNLETSRLTREEAGNLKNSIDLLRMEVTYLRQAIQVVK